MSDPLKHSGVLGMHWGRRKGESPGVSRPPSADHATVSAIRNKKLHEMSNDEIQKLATRMQLEKQYRDLNPDKVTKGKKSISNIFGAIGAIGVGTGAIIALATNGQKLLSMIKPPLTNAIDNAAVGKLALERLAKLKG